MQFSSIVHVDEKSKIREKQITDLTDGSIFRLSQQNVDYSFLFSLISKSQHFLTRYEATEKFDKHSTFQVAHSLLVQQCVICNAEKLFCMFGAESVILK